jgi:hypothetical protein
MKKYVRIILLFIFPFYFSFSPIGANYNGALFAQVVSINTTGAAGNNSAILDVDANNKGFLIPRVSLTSATDVITITSPAISLLIYNTATIGTYPNNIIPGFYYWDGAKWIPLIGQPAVIAFADFYALMPSDNSATIAAGSAIAFPNAGPTSSSSITAISNTQFQLSDIGTYMVTWQVSINEAGQLVLELNGTENLATVVGRATGTSQIVGNRIITTLTSNTILRVVNPIGNPTVLTVTTTAGGARPASASLVIMRLK